jgi:2-haloacid dehalogenase
MLFPGQKPKWLTFDCYGTLIQWDEGLLNAVNTILSKQPKTSVDAATLIHVYDKYEHGLEQQKPHRSFRSVAGDGLKMAMEELTLSYEAADIEILTSSISKMSPFSEVKEALSELKASGFKLCIISNTDDDIIAGNVAQMGGHIDRVITAQQATSYKPSHHIFNYAHHQLSVLKEDIIHICASPHLDLVAARDLGFRCIWIDRGTARKPLPDYTPNAVFHTLSEASQFLKSVQWV